MLQNAYFLATIGADTAENEQHFAEIFAGRIFEILLDAEVAVGRPDGVKEGAVGHAARRHPGEDLSCN